MSQVGHRSIEEVHEEADKLGLVAFIAGENELLLDMDGKAEYNINVMECLRTNGIVVSRILRTMSKGGVGHHYYMQLNQTIPPYMRIAIQASLGSDPVREILSLIRLREGFRLPYCFIRNQATSR